MTRRHLPRRPPIYNRRPAVVAAQNSEHPGLDGRAKAVAGDDALATPPGVATPPPEPEPTVEWQRPASDTGDDGDDGGTPRGMAYVKCRRCRATTLVSSDAKYDVRTCRQCGRGV